MKLLYVITLLRVGAVIAMLSLGAIHSNRYTYWNYVLQTMFYIFLSFSYIRKDVFFFKVLTIFAFPIVFGSVWFVLIYITVVLQLDEGWLLWSATYFGGGHMSVGSVHTFDFLIHAVPVIDFLIVLVRDYFIDANTCVRSFTEFIPNYSHWKLLMYYYIAPFIPISVYCCFFDPFREYPTDTNPLIAVGFGGLFYFIVMTYTYFSLVATDLGNFVRKLEGKNKGRNFF
jgi:magnesium-transporting ATPase (P-type)